MSEYPTYHTHGRYMAPVTKPNPYSEVSGASPLWTQAWGWSLPWAVWAASHVTTAPVTLLSPGMANGAEAQGQRGGAGAGAGVAHGHGLARPCPEP